MGNAPSANAGEPARLQKQVPSFTELPPASMIGDYVPILSTEAEAQACRIDGARPAVQQRRATYDFRSYRPESYRGCDKNSLHLLRAPGGPSHHDGSSYSLASTRQSVPGPRPRSQSIGSGLPMKRPERSYSLNDTSRKENRPKTAGPGLVRIDADGTRTCIDPNIPDDVHNGSISSGIRDLQGSESTIHLDETNHETHSTMTESTRIPYLPVRRRSLVLTPGLATRPVIERSSTDAANRRGNRAAVAANQRQQELKKRPDWDGLLPPGLPFAQEYQRSVSPMETGYEQLGGMRFGTLRVMNGSPVPSPSERSITRGAYLEDPTPTFLVNAVEGSSMDKTATTVSEVRDALGNATNFAQPTPRRQTTRELLALSQEETGAVAEKSAPSQPYSSDRTVVHDNNSGQPTTNGRRTPERESWTAEYTATEVLQVREDACAKPARDDKTDDIGYLQLRREDSGIVSASSSASSRKAPSNADSGYSSGASPVEEIAQVSLDEIMKRNQGDQATTAASQMQDNAEVYNGVRRLRSFSSLIWRRSSSASLTPVASQKLPRASKDELARNSHLQRSVSLSVASRHHGESVKTGRFQRFILGSRGRAQSLGPYIAHSDFSTVPTVPDEVEERLERRSKSFPTLSKKLTQAKSPRRDSILTAGNMEIIEEESQDQQPVTGASVDGVAKPTSPIPATGHFHRKPLPVPQPGRSQRQPAAPAKQPVADARPRTSHHTPRGASAPYVAFKPSREDLAAMPAPRWKDDLDTRSYEPFRIEGPYPNSSRNWSLPRGAMVDGLWSCRAAARELSRQQPVLVEQAVQE